MRELAQRWEELIGEFTGEDAHPVAPTRMPSALRVATRRGASPFAQTVGPGSAETDGRATTASLKSDLPNRSGADDPYRDEGAIRKRDLGTSAFAWAAPFPDGEDLLIFDLN